MAEDRTFLGRGFHFPPQVDPTTGRFLTSSGEEDIKEAIYLILMTRRGERQMNPDFGCDIERYVFDLPDMRAEKGIRNAVRVALIKWEPRIDDIQVELNLSRMSEGIVFIEIGYRVRKNNNTVNLVFPYYLEGQGTWR